MILFLFILWIVSLFVFPPLATVIGIGAFIWAAGWAAGQIVEDLFD